MQEIFEKIREPLQAEVEIANRNFHDRISETYESTTLRADTAYRDFQIDLCNLPLKEHGSLLDLGTGSGKILQLAETAFKLRVGLDISLNMLRLAKRYSCNVIQSSCFTLPFSDDSFDVITVYSVLHHLFDWTPMLQEAYRVLAPGGWLITDNDSNAKFHEKFQWWLKVRKTLFNRRSKTLSNPVKDLERMAEYHHTAGLQPDAVKNSLKEAGFNRFEVEYSHPPVPDRFTKLLMLIETPMTKEYFRYYLTFKAQK